MGSPEGYPIYPRLIGGFFLHGYAYLYDLVPHAAANERIMG